MPGGCCVNNAALVAIHADTVFVDRMRVHRSHSVGHLKNVLAIEECQIGAQTWFKAPSITASYRMRSVFRHSSPDFGTSHAKFRHTEGHA